MILAAHGSLFLSLVSGAYAEDQKRAIEPVGPHIAVRHSFRDSDGGGGAVDPLSGTCGPYTALRGEKREYRLIVRADSNGAELERRELWLRIDKCPPDPPIIQPDPGT